MALVHLYDMLFLNMIFTFNITVYDYPKKTKIIDLFYTCGANFYGQVWYLFLRHLVKHVFSFFDVFSDSL